MQRKLKIRAAILEKLETLERTQSWLARKVFCDNSSLSKMLKGKRDFNDELIERISKALELDFSENQER